MRLEAEPYKYVNLGIKITPYVSLNWGYDRPLLFFNETELY